MQTDDQIFDNTNSRPGQAVEIGLGQRLFIDEQGLYYGSLLSRPGPSVIEGR
jgi:hypothetical protein